MAFILGFIVLTALSVGFFNVIKIKGEVTSKYNASLYSFLLYLLNVIVWGLYLCIVSLIVKTDKNLVMSLLITIPIYVIIFVIFNYQAIKKVSLTELGEIFFKQMQSFFEIALAVLTISLLICTMAGVLGGDIQAKSLLIVLGFYTPIVPILGAVKYKNTLF